MRNPLVLGLPWLLGMGVAGQGPPPATTGLDAARKAMVRDQLAARGIRDARILEAMGRVPRHAFLPLELRDQAYADGPLPIGHGQTISQPFVVAFMTVALALKPGERVLEIGTGSGYQAAVLSELGAEVYTVELVAPLARRAEGDLARLGYRNVHVRQGDGFRGWPEAAPFDAIVVTCAPDHVPRALVDQLKVGGRMVLPVGPAHGVQSLLRLRRTPRGLEQEELLPVRFVPMVEAMPKR